MAFNGSGTFVRLYNWVTDKANGVNITASRMDAEMDGFAAGLSNCVTRDGQGRMTADLVPVSDNNLSLGSNSLRWSAINGKPFSSISPIVVSKASTTSRSSTFTPAADPDLSIPITSIGTYLYEAFIDMWGTTTSSQGIRWNMYGVGVPTFAWTSGTYANQFNQGNSSGAMSSSVSAVVNTLADMSALGPGSNVLYIRGKFVATGVSGATFGFAWSQNSPSSNATNIGAGSYLLLRQFS